MSLFLITFFVGVLAYLWSSRFKHAARWWKRVPALRDRGFDFAELDLPAGWRPGRDLNDSAGIEAVDLLHGRYAVVISESREDFDARLNLDEFAVGVRDALTTGVRVLSCRQGSANALVPEPRPARTRMKTSGPPLVRG